MTASPAQQLFRQLTSDFPPESARWVLGRGITVLPLRKVPLRLIDFTNAKTWNAEEHPAKIERFRKKMRDGTQKPVVLVRRPDKPLLMVADGHHRSWAAREEDKPPLAWVVIADKLNGPWDKMHAQQKNNQGNVKLATPATQQQQQAATAAVPVLAVAAVLGSAVTAEAATGLLYAYFSMSGVPRQALLASLKVVMDMPPGLDGISGPASRNIVQLNRLRRAQFLISSALRVTACLREALSHDESLVQALAGAVTRERRFYGQHLEAGWNRMNAAARVDGAASDLGLLLGWNTVLDARTSPECRAADRHNFRADIMPSIGYPGMVHPHCRCYPGVPWRSARLLP